MKTRNIKVNTAEDIENLVNHAGKVQGEIAIETADNAKFDASSILGLFAVTPGSSMAVSYPETAEDFDDFLISLELQATVQLP